MISPHPVPVPAPWEVAFTSGAAVCGREGNVLHTRIQPHHTSMAVAVAVKVPGGIVLASGRAGPVPGRDATPSIVPLPEGCPAALLAWGSPDTGIPPAALAERFRGRISAGSEEGYSLHEIAGLFQQSVVEQDLPCHGAIIAGYDATGPRPEIWRIDLRAGEGDGPRCVAAGEGSAIHWAGEIGVLGHLCRGAGLACRG